MARVIGTAAIRLEADGRSLAREIRSIATKALKEGTAGIGPGSTEGIEKDADSTSKKVMGIFAGLVNAGRSAAAGFAQVAFAGMRLVLIGAAAATALAGVSTLATGLIGLVGAAAQAAGVVGLLPAVFALVKAASATAQIAMENVGESFKALASGDAAAFRESLKALAPEARKFMVEIAKVKPAFDDMKLGVQNEAFRGLGASVNALATRYLPLARSLFGGLAQSMNAAAKEAISFATEGEVVGQTTLLVNSLKQAFANLVPAVQPALSAILDLTQVGATFLPGMTTAVAGLAEQFGAFIRNAAATGQLEAFFQRSIDTLQQFAQIAQQFGQGLAAVFRAADAAGGGTLNSLLAIGTAFNSWASSIPGQQALIGFFTTMRQIVAAVVPVFLQLATIVGTTLAPILGNLASTIGPALLPVVSAIGTALQAAAPGIAALASGFATLIQAAAPLIAIIGKIAGIIGGALGKVFEALAPVIEQVATAIDQGLNSVLPTLQPIIAQIATLLGQVLTALVPLIPAFFQIVGAVAPLLPPLLQLVAAILPTLVGLVTKLVPIIVSVARVFADLIPIFTEVAQFVLGILIPPIELIATIVAAVANQVANVFNSMAGLIRNVFALISSIITGAWGAIINTFSAAVTFLTGIVSGAFNKVREFISSTIGDAARAVGRGIEDIVRFFRELPGKVLGFLGDLARDALKAGENLVDGIIRGIGNVAGKIVAKVKQIASDAWNGFLDFFGISSPAKRAIADAEHVGDGIVIGLTRSIAPAVAAAAKLSEAVSASLLPAVDPSMSLDLSARGRAGATAAGAAGVTVLNQSVHMLPGSDVQQFTSEVLRRGAQALASGDSALPVSAGSVQRGLTAPDSFVSLGGF
jgi:phage-related protein